MMFRVALISMPFGAVHIPSLGLTQLKAALSREFGNAARGDIFYLNHDFAEFFGLDLYRYLSDDSRTTVTGLTDWLFRDEAFPGAEDTSARYIARYMPALGCRCDDGKRRELDGCATAPSCTPTEASSVPCCLEPGILRQLLAKREKLGAFMDELIDRYELASYPLVGFTSMFDQTVASIAMARRLKEREAQVTTVMGGASCEPGVGRVLAKRIDAIDYVFAGPALRSFPKFVGHMLRGERDECERIRGVHSRGGLRQDFPSLDAGVGDEEDINNRLPLDYDDFLAGVRSKCADVIPELFFETSRGCWWGERAHCTFCGINGATMTFRSMSAENVIAQFSELFERYPDVQRFVAVDNILDTSYYETVFPFVKAPAGASIFYETRVIDDEEQMRLLAEAGVTRIQPGIEALSTPVLKLMQKGSTAFRNIKFLKKIFGYGIEIDWNLLTGFPNEDAEAYEHYIQVIPSLVHLPAPVATFPVRFDRHSPYQKNPDAYGLKLRPLDFYSMIYPLAEEDLEEIAYFWSDQNFPNRYMFNVARWQRKIEGVIDHWRARWYERDGKLKPELRLTHRGDAVYDSRSGEAIEHPLSSLARAMLERLERPMSFIELQRALDADDDDLRAELELLKERRLLFSENDRMMSLVCGISPIGGRVRSSARESVSEPERGPPQLVDALGGAALVDRERPFGDLRDRVVGGPEPYGQEARG